ncbi:MAG: NTP transferase domain-containing protein [Candidatus Wildermuthbacteria bacterium]|nr:NTP transferase domain-containing protein [Candidatus Wildermuthbacteria bacterium]
MAIQFVVLAAGMGKRLQVGGYNGPKILYPLLGRPILSWILESIQSASGFAEPLIVIGYQAEKVREQFKNCRFVVQEKLLGTGEALRIAYSELNSKEPVLVLNGDLACVTPEGLENVAQRLTQQSVVMTLASTTVSNFSGWRSPLRNYGQVIRNVHGQIVAIVEGGAIQPNYHREFELNVGIYCFKRSWLEREISNIPEDPETKEYYLTYLAQLAAAEGRVRVASLSPEEAVGVNTPKDARVAEHLLEHRMMRMRRAIHSFVSSERDRLGIKKLGTEPGFEGSCIAQGEFNNLLAQLLHTKEGYGHWKGLEDPGILLGVHTEVRHRLSK